MDNVLDNGTVLPSGLLSQQGTAESIAAFNRSYRDTRLKAGIVSKTYDVNDPANQNGLCTEYDVITIEQFENKGSTSILYRNCISTQGFGSIADFLEFNLRAKTTQLAPGSPTFGNQDGSIVLIQCLDGIGNKAVVVGNLIHPDRTTKIQSVDPQLAGSYNGINFAINPDGSFSIIFNGKTNNKGVPADSSLNTVLQIKPDGGFQLNNPKVSIEGSASGDLTITANGDTNITTQGKTTITSTGDIVANTQGDANITASGNAVVQASQIELNGTAGQVLTNLTDPVIDTIFGEPTMGVPTVQAGN